MLSTRNGWMGSKALEVIEIPGKIVSERFQSYTNKQPDEEVTAAFKTRLGNIEFIGVEKPSIRISKKDLQEGLKYGFREGRKLFNNPKDKNDDSNYDSKLAKSIEKLCDQSKF